MVPILVPGKDCGFHKENGFQNLLWFMPIFLLKTTDFLKQSHNNSAAGRALSNSSIRETE